MWVARSWLVLSAAVLPVERAAGYKEPPPHIDVGKFAKQLADPDVAKRLAAVRNLARAEHWGDIPPVATVLAKALAKDKSAEVRAAAATAIGRIVCVEKQEVLTDPKKHRYPWGGAVRLAFQSLTSATKDNDRKVQAAALQALGSFRAARSYEILRAALNSQEGILRAAAIRGIQRAGNKTFAPRILQALRDPETDVKRAAAGALGTMRVQQAVPPLMEMLKDPSCPVRGEAAEALGALKARQAGQLLIDMLKDPKCPLRGRIARVLGDLGIEKAVPVLAEALKDPNAAAGAAAALRRIRSPEAVEALLSGLGSPHVSVRRAVAADLCWWIRDSRAVEPFIQVLADKDAEVRCYAACALRNLGDKRAVGPLVKAMKSAGSGSTAAMAEALGFLGDARAVPALIEALRSSDAATRSVAAGALGRLQDKRAIEPLRPLLKDKDFNVRYAAGEALYNLGVKDTGWQPPPPMPDEPAAG